MPAITSPQDLSALIGFTLPQERLDHDESRYLNYEPGVQRPFEKIRCSMTDLRPMLESSTESVRDQLRTKGFAVAKHGSDLLDSIPSEEGTRLYLDQCCEFIKTTLGCDKVIAWNSVCRRNEPEKVKLKHVERQQEAEKGFVPTSRLQPVAGFAHVDQDATWGKELCSRAAKRPASEFKRVQIVNIWRPLRGPVTNAPLAVLPFPSMRPESMSTHGHLFGTGYDIHHHTTQDWGYIRHQMPDEIILLKCYDSANEFVPNAEQQEAVSDRKEAPFSAHVAVDVGDQDDLPAEQGGGIPRESIEVRLVAVWE